MGPNPQFPEDLVTFTEEILNEILLFSCSVCIVALDLSFYMTYKKNTWAHFYSLFLCKFVEIQSFKKVSFHDPP